MAHMTRRKTTVYLDTELLRATKIAAAREDKPEYAIIEEALRQRLGRDLFERVRAKTGLDPDDAMRLALKESKKARSKTR
jgi:predicted transcriptional regulator